MLVYLDRYPLRTPLQAHESLYSFMHRLRKRNDFSWDEIRWDLGNRPMHAVLSAQQLDALARLSLVPLERLADAQHGIAFEAARFYGQEVSVSWLSRGYSRTCLLCMCTGGSHLRVWDLKALELCPIHNTALIDRCPVCARQLSWLRADLHKCPKGHVLTLPDHSVTSQPGGYFAERVIFETIGLQHGLELARPQLPPVVRDLPLPAIIEFSKFLGVLVNDRDKNLSLERRHGSFRGSSSKLMNAGVRIARRWPDSFHGLIQSDVRGRRYSRRDRVVTLSQLHIARTSLEHATLLDQELRKVHMGREAEELRRWR
jgi:hypothetical protein